MALLISISPEVGQENGTNNSSGKYYVNAHSKESAILKLTYQQLRIQHDNVCKFQQDVMGGWTPNEAPASSFFALFSHSHQSLRNHLRENGFGDQVRLGRDNDVRDIIHIPCMVTHMGPNSAGRSINTTSSPGH